MPQILESDILLLESDRLTDDSDGGGLMTGNVVVDGLANNLFPNISTLDRVVGRVNIRKAYPAVRTPNRAMYHGAHVIVAEPAEDPTVHVALFDTGSWTDRRDHAQDRLENFLAKGPVYPGYLFSMQYEGSRAVSIFQRPEQDLPEVGEVLFLIQSEGQPEEFEQAVRITKVEESLQQFTGVSGTFTRRILDLEIADPLETNFQGIEITHLDDAVSPARIRRSVFANAARYYSITPLAQPAEVGDPAIHVASIFTTLVPSTRSETPILDQPGSGEARIPLATTPRLLDLPMAQHSTRVAVNESTRAFNYVFMLSPLPAPGSVLVSYRSQGKWYTLRDDGNGALEGTGAGSVNYLTGSVNATLAELPDIGSIVIVQWGQRSSVVDRSGQAGWRLPEYQFRLADEDIEPDTLSITWTSGGTVVSVSDDGTGQLSGTGGSGTIEYHSGFVWLVPSAMPDPGVQFISEYLAGLLVEELITGLSADSMGFVTLTTEHEITPGTLSAEWYTQLTIDRTRGNKSETTRATKTVTAGT